MARPSIQLNPASCKGHSVIQHKVETQQDMMSNNLMFHHLSCHLITLTTTKILFHYTLTCTPQTTVYDLLKFTFHFQTDVKYFCSIYLKAAQFTNCTKDADWETLTQHRTITYWCALFKAYSGEWAWKAIHDRLRRPYYLSRVDHVRKIMDRKQRTDIGKYSFVNRTKKTGTNYLQKH
jgi:hypothetical protein